MLAGCSGGESESDLPEAAEQTEGWTGYAPLPEGAVGPCSQGDAIPIGEGKALATLRRHGFVLSLDRSGYCLDGVAAFQSAEDDFDEDGSVSCFLYAKSFADASKKPLRRGADGADAELLFENLACTIFTDSPTGEEKIDRLEAAFEELERAIRS